MTRRFRGFARAKSGTAAIEFAFIVPIMLMMFAGVVEIGRAFQVYNAVNRLATQYAITWSDCSDLPVGTCNTELTAFGSSNMIANLIPQLLSTELTLNMFQVNMSGTTPTVTYAYPVGATMTGDQITAARGILTDKQAGVVVTASYRHSLQFFPGLMTPYLGSVLSPTYTAVQLKG